MYSKQLQKPEIKNEKVAPYIQINSPSILVGFISIFYLGYQLSKITNIFGI
jgi:hypothetical protein